MSSRFKPFDPEKLPADAKAVYDRILRDRGYMPGPYQFWFAAPGFADRIERVEEFLRHQVSLDDRHVEIAVLCVAKRWKAQYVWTSHAPATTQAGVDAAAVEAIRTGREPVFAREDEAVCYAICHGLLNGDGIGDPLWERAKAVFGERGVNELLGLLGLYTSVCLTMVTYRMPTKNGEPDPLA